MAKVYRPTSMIRLVNSMMTALARRGRGPASVLTTTGRKTRQPHRVPVSPIVVGDVE
ncbi:MAG: hypothetical protein ACT4OP_12380 [Actinomycetota bacterium]